MSINWTEEEWQEFREGFYERDQSQSAATTRSEPLVTECDHIEGGEIPHTSEGIVVWLYFTYCPKCGVKL
jgi:hypothetical protein